MGLYSKWNNPKTYADISSKLKNLPVPATAVFNCIPGETITSLLRPYRQINLDEVKLCMDPIDFDLTARVASSKYLTSLQIYEYLQLQGYNTNRKKIKRHIDKLARLRVIQEKELNRPDLEYGLRFYEIDVNGFIIAKEMGVSFHTGIGYLSYRKRQDLKLPDIQPMDVKRVLMGNQFILGLLMSNAMMERFGIMETLRVLDEDLQETKCLIRTAAYVRIGKDFVLAVEVARDVPENYISLDDKVSRYSRILKNKKYPENNFHGDSAFPQMVICGESLEHNLKIMEYLKTCGLWNQEDILLFTEDLLNIRDSLNSIYALTDDGRQLWYRLPENYYSADRNRRGA